MAQAHLHTPTTTPDKTFQTPLNPRPTQPPPPAQALNTDTSRTAPPPPLSLHTFTPPKGPPGFPDLPQFGPLTSSSASSSVSSFDIPQLLPAAVNKGAASEEAWTPSRLGPHLHQSPCHGATRSPDMYARGAVWPAAGLVPLSHTPLSALQVAGDLRDQGRSSGGGAAAARPVGVGGGLSSEQSMTEAPRGTAAAAPHASAGWTFSALTKRSSSTTLQEYPLTVGCLEDLLGSRAASLFTTSTLPLADMEPSMTITANDRPLPVLPDFVEEWEGRRSAVHQATGVPPAMAYSGDNAHCRHQQQHGCQHTQLGSSTASPNTQFTTHHHRGHSASGSMFAQHPGLLHATAVWRAHHRANSFGGHSPSGQTVAAARTFVPVVSTAQSSSLAGGSGTTAAAAAAVLSPEAAVFGAGVGVERGFNSPPAAAILTEDLHGPMGNALGGNPSLLFAAGYKTDYAAPGLFRPLEGPPHADVSFPNVTLQSVPSAPLPSNPDASPALPPASLQAYPLGGDTMWWHEALGTPCFPPSPLKRVCSLTDPGSTTAAGTGMFCHYQPALRLSETSAAPCGNSSATDSPPAPSGPPGQRRPVAAPGSKHNPRSLCGVDPRLCVGNPGDVEAEVFRRNPGLAELLRLQPYSIRLRNVAVRSDSCPAELLSSKRPPGPITPDELTVESGLLRHCFGLPSSIGPDLVRTARQAVSRADGTPGSGLETFFWVLHTKVGWLLKRPVFFKGQLLRGEIHAITGLQRAQSFAQVTEQRSKLGELLMVLYSMLKVDSS